MMWGWEIVLRFPGAVAFAWCMFAFWGVMIACAVHQR
jgi:hypothetical protein